MSPTAKDTENQSKKELAGFRYEHLDQPKKSKFQALEDMDSIHKELAKNLFTSSESGLKIFRSYNSRPDNVLTSPGLADASVFHKILERMQQLVRYEESLELIRTVPPVAREFLEYLVIKHQDLLTRPNDDGFRPLDTAALKVKPVVFLVADLVLSEDMLKALPAKTCPAILKARPTDTCRLDLPGSLRSAFAKDAKDAKDGDIPLPGACVHETVKLDELEKWSAQLRDTMSGVLQPRKAGNQRGSSGTILHTLLDEDSFAKDSSVKTASFQRLIELCAEATLSSSDLNGYCPLHKAILLYEKDGIDFCRLYDVIESLVHQFPGSIYLNVANSDGAGPKNPYSLLQAVDPRNRPFSQQHEDKWESWTKAEKLLKHTCIGDDRDLDEKLIYLYGDLKNAQNIYLDMAFPNLINRDFVTSLSDTVKFRFDTALEYVSLRHDQPKASNYHLNPSVRDATSQERNPYQGVFEWLQTEWHVEKIFKVIVEDLVPYPHTDEAIRVALRPFKVEKWDWRKLDICSQTIIDAANGTRELYLQSSGNEAVLRSWGCRHGLAELTELKSITITMHPDLRETKKDCQRYFDNFKVAFCRWRPDMKKDINLKWVGESTTQSNSVGDTGSSPGTHQSDQVAWVQTMKPFIEFLSTRIHPDMEEKEHPAYVKIALIDNGVNSAADEIPTLEKGKSYYGQRDKELPFRDYFTGPSHHGTQMASCIHKVCPVVQLYVARMDDSKPQLEKFTVDSAIKAVEWATKMGVDIISMSWTFHEKDATDEQKTSFKKAIQEASNAGIILFNSLNDTEMTVLSEWLPISYTEIIRIGSATKWGEKAESSKRGAANYLFPGQEITLNTDGEEDVVSGSSLATAFAAGLAGLIIYTTRALPCIDSNLTDSEKQKLTMATTRAGMERVFKVLGGKPNETSALDLFVELGTHFPKDPDKEADEGGKPQVLRSFLTRLLLLQ